MWYVPFVKPEPPADIEQVTIPLKLCGLSKVSVAVPVTVVTPVIGKPMCKSFSMLSAVSLVILFLRSLVTTLPTGDLFANDFDAAGLSSTLSRSNCGYRSSTFWLYLSARYSSVIWLSAFKTYKW